VHVEFRSIYRLLEDNIMRLALSLCWLAIHVYPALEAMLVHLWGDSAAIYVSVQIGSRKISAHAFTGASEV